MDNSHIRALKPLQNLGNFPPHRRLLMSETCSTLLQILSYCPSTDDSATDKQKLDDNGSSKLGKENGVGELVDRHLIRSENLLVTGPAHKKSDNLVVQQGSGDGNEGSSPDGYGEFTGPQMEVDLDHLNHKSDATEDDRGDSVTNDIIDMSCVVEKILACNDQMVKEPGNSCSTHESEVKEPDPIRQVELDKEPSIDDVSAAIESCFGADAIADLSQPTDLSGEKMGVAESHLSEEMKHGLRVKEMELETLVSSAGTKDSSVHIPVGEEMEEGEAFGDFVVFDESDYDILNQVGNEKKDEADESPADILGREEFAFDVQVNSPKRKDAVVSSSVNAVDEDSTFLGGEFIRKFREEPEDNTEKVFPSKDVETSMVCVYDTVLDSGNVAGQVGGDVEGREEFAFDVQVNAPQKKDAYASSSINAVYEDNTFMGGEFIRNFREEQEDNTEKVFCSKDVETRKNENIGKKEKKRGPSTKERKANRKAKERIKRAKERIKLGIKRPMLPPVVKPKVVRYCHHYLKGRCFEGDKCNFSHNTVPLTKSKPCCHFARQSCMKGDDCPFDHQLSKYPCDKYASQGFCNRGADCLFSHEVTAKTVSVTSPTASNPSNSNSLIQVNTGMSNKDVKSASGSTGLVPGKSTKQTVSEHVRKPAASAPKGVTFLSHGKSLQGDARKHKEVGLSSKADDVGKISCQIIHSKSDNAQKPNGYVKGTSTRTPQGMNFLSFGRVPLAKPSSDTLSSMLNMDYGVESLQLGSMNNSKEVATCSKRDDSFKDDSQANISAKLVSMNQMLTGNPPGSVPRGVNFLSVDKAVEDRSHPNEFNCASSPIERRQNAPNTTSNEMPFRQLSSLFPARQSLIRSAQKCNAEIACSSKSPFFANTPSSIQKALRSTLAFAAKFDLGVKYGMSNDSPDISSAINHKAGSSKDR
ncbi:unnamed protein product [Withania somnifera]